MLEGTFGSHFGTGSSTHSAYLYSTVMFHCYCYGERIINKALCERSPAMKCTVTMMTSVA